MDSADALRLIAFLCIIYLDIKILLKATKSSSGWKIYILPFIWAIHTTFFYIVTILWVMFGITIGLSSHFLNYWSQLIRLQTIVSVGIMVLELWK